MPGMARRTLISSPTRANMAGVPGPMNQLNGVAGATRGGGIDRAVPNCPQLRAPETWVRWLHQPRVREQHVRVDEPRASRHEDVAIDDSPGSAQQFRQAGLVPGTQMKPRPSSAAAAVRATLVVPPHSTLTQWLTPYDTPSPPNAPTPTTVPARFSDEACACGRSAQ